MASSNSLSIFASVSKEFRCDESGNGFISLRGLAKLCGIRYQTWGQGDSIFTAKIDETVATQGFIFDEVTVKGVPDTIAAVVIMHYAQAGKEVAQKTLMSFAAFGLRKAIQEVIGYAIKDEKMYSLEMVVRRTPATWERMFSSTWIQQAEAVTGWSWEWSCMGTFINDCVYSYLPTDIVAMLRDLNPKNEDGRGRLHKHHQFLQPEIREIVSNHLGEVESLMKAAKGNMDLFKLLMVNHYGRFRLSGDGDMPLFKTQTVFVLAN
jgi:hypothetical protein